MIAWSDCFDGNCVLIEMPSRWYLGVVESRNQMTVRLSPALCGHDLGDMGQFLDGKIKGSELTPLPRPIELNLMTADSVQTYPKEYFDKINKRTHQPG